MKVKAIQLGYYGHKRRREGEVFELVASKTKDGKIVSVEEQFSDKWMEPVEVVESKKPKGRHAEQADA